MKTFDSYKDVPDGWICRPVGSGETPFLKELWIKNNGAYGMKGFFLRDVLGKWEGESISITITKDSALKRINEWLSAYQSTADQVFKNGARLAIEELFK